MSFFLGRRRDLPLSNSTLASDSSPKGRGMERKVLGKRHRAFSSCAMRAEPREEESQVQPKPVH